MSIKMEFYSKIAKQQFKYDFGRVFKDLQYAVYQEDVNAIVKNWKSCIALCKRTRIKTLFGRLHLWCCDMHSTPTNKSLFKEANKMMKESQ